MLKNFFTVILIGVLMSSNTVKSLESQWQGTDEVKLRLISPIKNTDKKDELIVGLEYALSEGWKTYWKSPGAGGFSQTIKYENSERKSKKKRKNNRTKERTKERKEGRKNKRN